MQKKNFVLIFLLIKCSRSFSSTVLIRLVNSIFAYSATEKILVVIQKGVCKGREYVSKNFVVFSRNYRNYTVKTQVQQKKEAARERGRRFLSCLESLHWSPGHSCSLGLINRSVMTANYDVIIVIILIPHKVIAQKQIVTTRLPQPHLPKMGHVVWYR